MPKFTRENAAQQGAKGGRATVEKHGHSYMQKIAKRGFHAQVRKHFGGDYRKAINTLIVKGLIAGDPVPENGAWTKRQVPDRLPSDYVPPNDEDAPAV